MPNVQVVYIAAADNAGGRDLAAAVLSHYGAAVPVRPLARPDASGIDCSKVSAAATTAPSREVKQPPFAGAAAAGLGTQALLARLPGGGRQAEGCPRSRRLRCQVARVQ